ncbi:hypothetical protein DFH09DRAFT_1096797 [Mycena vulgaris]|nr:hypothetical protein DFH09DRAFT_1096797 [Mycena vulgaris]
MFPGGKLILPCVSFLFALAAQTSAYAIPSRSLVARHHTISGIVCGVPSATNGTMACTGITFAGPDAANFTTAEVTAALLTSPTEFQIDCAMPHNVGDAISCTGAATAGGNPTRRRVLAARHHTNTQITCSSSATVGSSFTCTGTTSLGPDAVNATAAETATKMQFTAPAASLVAVPSSSTNISATAATNGEFPLDLVAGKKVHTLKPALKKVARREPRAV